MRRPSQGGTQSSVSSRAVSARMRFTAPSKYCTSTYRAPFS